MSAKKTILSIAKEKNISTDEIARIMKYDHVQSFYRAMKTSRTIKLNRIVSLSKLLNIPLCDLINIFNQK